MASRYLEPRLERASRAALTRLQTRRLQAQVRHAYARSPFYRRKLKAAGVTPDAAQDLGCLVFPVGGLSTDARIDALLSYPITVLGCTPSYALFLAETAAKKGIDLGKQTKLRITWHTGEPGAAIPATKAKIEAAF